MSEGAHQLAKANIDLSQRTEEQAAALQETAASLEELSATVSQNSDHTQRANTRAWLCGGGIRGTYFSAA